MAKGDSGEMQSLINQQQNRGQGMIDTAQKQTGQQYQNMYGNYQAGTNRNMADYGNVMGGYNTFLGGGNPGMTGGYTPGAAPSNMTPNTQMTGGGATGGAGGAQPSKPRQVNQGLAGMAQGA